MKKRIFLLAIAIAGMNTGCMTYRHKTEICNEASLETAARPGNGLYRLVEFRFRSDLEGNTGKEEVVDGKTLTAWLVQEYPRAFSTAEDAIPLIVRQTMTSPPEVKTKDGFRPSVFDIIVTQLTLGLWPATISGDYKFETEIQLPDESYAAPFVWETRYTDHVANTIVAYMYYPSSRGYETGKFDNTMAKLQKANQLQRTIISRKTTEEEKQAAKTEQLWLVGGYQNSPESMKRGTALGIIGAINQLNPEEMQAVRDNPVARYLADKADGKAGVEGDATSGQSVPSRF